MNYLALPLMILIIGYPDATKAQLADFSRFATVQGEEVTVVDMFGAESLGRVVAATDTSVTLGLGAGTRTFDRADVFQADRLHDSSTDGLVKGMAIGALAGWAAAMEQGASVRDFAAAISINGLIGYLLDRSSLERVPLYRK